MFKSLCRLLGTVLLFGISPHAVSEPASFYAGPEGMPLDGIAVAHDDFPAPEILRPAVDFWTRIYTEVSTDQGFVHDSKYPSVVYETVDLQKAKYHNRHARKRIKARKRHWRRALKRLATAAGPRNREEQYALEQLEVALGREPTARDLGHAADRLRFQLGQRDKFRLGLVRAGAYEEEMRRVFRRYGLPEDLSYLPHVESSFNTRAYSKYGASGMWQFMRSTGRLFLTVDYVVDERLDPMLATDAAARLLKHNYAALGTWPLAITAYNHGTAGMKRAKRKLKTSDFGTIVERYRGRSFGFASRNFYAQFLAARRVARDYASYFGTVERDAPVSIDRVELPFYVEARHLEQHLGVGAGTLRRHNPSLRPSVFRADKRIPKGYTLQLPNGTLGDDAQTWLAGIPPEHRYPEQRLSRFHVVRRGDTLSGIARIHNTKVSTIAALNGLTNRNRIYPGQRLEVLSIPGSRTEAAKKAPPAVVVVEQIAEPSRPEVAVVSAHEVEAAPAPADMPTEGNADTIAALDGPTNRDRVYPGQRRRVPSIMGASGYAEADHETPPRDVEVVEHAVEASQLAVLDAVEPVTATVGLPATETVEVRLDNGRPLLPDDSPWRRLDGDSTYVYSDETLGHFADWLDIPTQRLRNLNNLPWRTPINIGQSLRLDFSRVSPEQFIERRLAYHQRIEDRFFARHRITELLHHELRRGESLWTLSREVYAVPSWLIQRCNPEATINHLRPGARIKIPVVELLSQS